ncbi:MAG: hypothetical protein AAGF28_05255 [Pseudomonadota bacterium]
MKILFVCFLSALALTMSVTAGEAVSRYDTQRMSCDRLQSALATERTAMLRFPSRRNPQLLMYDFYTDSARRCTTGGFGRMTSVPTSDRARCRVYKCERRFRGGRD